VQDTALTAVPALSSSPARLAAWLRLERCAGIGPRTASALLDVFGSPDAVFAADFAALAAHVNPAQARALLQPPADTTRRLLDATLAWLDRPGHGVLALGEPGYPELLSHIPDPPLLLYIRGDARLLDGPCLAIVGSRNASVQGRANATAFAEALSGAGLCIVSGLALGIDAAAHRGGLGGPSSTVAVLGTGIDVVYPQRNAELAAEIARRGLLLSEFPLGTAAVAHNFPRRNRLISGLARGCLVVEAAVASGSLITARLAADQGREVFAIPGSIHSPLSKGCHLLIKSGAKLVDSADDVLAELSGFRPSGRASTAEPRAASQPATGLLAVMGHDPVDVDVLCERAGLSAEQVASQLLRLELEGRVTALPGGLYQRLEKP